MCMDDLQRGTKDHCKALLQSHLFYIRTGVAPTEYNQSKIRDQIDGRIDAIPDRLAAFVEDLQALHDSDVYTEDDWPDLWALLADPEPRNAAYTDLFGPTSDVDKQAYQTGLQLGHLARLLLQFSGQPIDKQRKDREAALAAFTLGIKGYGLASVDSQHSEVQDDVLHHDDLGGDKLFDINQLDDGLQSINDFGTRIEKGLVDDLPQFSEAAKDVIADAGLPPIPPVVNAVYSEFNNQQTGDAGDDFEAAINSIQQDYEIDRIEQMCNCLEEDIPELMNQSSNMGPDITEAEVLYATCMSSESGGDIDVIRDIRDM